jgi:polyisoprenoid-binding protein YceI
MTPAKDPENLFAMDARASLFTVQGFATGIAAVVAHSPKFAVRDFVGEIRFAPDAAQNASVQMTINRSSLEIIDEVTRSERREIERVMFEEVLESRFYPKIEYRSTRVNATKLSENIYRIVVGGELTLRGIGRTVGLDAQVVSGEDAIKAQGSFSVLQSDFGLKIASVAGGSLKMKDELKCGYFIVARRRD